MNFSNYQPDPAGATRHLFFTGKGGVGKTSVSCATALRLAEAGRRVLLVSTDPASNLDEVLEVRLSNTPTQVPGAPNLKALNINPAEAAAAYREKLIGPLRGLLPAAALSSMEEQLSGACTVEIAAFDEFSGLLGDDSVTKEFDHIVFDTAPTGHTLRLMGLAKAWDGFLNSNQSGTSCLGPLAGLDRQREVYEKAVATLSDPASTSLILVSRPQVSALREAERTSKELRLLGLTNQTLVVNGFFRTTCPHDATAEAMERRGREALADSAQFTGLLPTFTVPLRAINILGLAGLRLLLSDDSSDSTAPGEAVSPADGGPELGSLAGLLGEIEAGGRGVVMTMGKGGVGKTTVAAALAVILARRGHQVRLSTTDPAAHLAQTLHGQVPGLELSRIDPTAETEGYRQEVMAAQASKLDEAGKALLEEDLRSPCTEEIAVFRAFAREVGRGMEGFVVLDTAPTGHTLLLLDASESYHRELSRQARSGQSEDVQHLLERLRDPKFTRVLLVTLPEATPVHEAAALQEDLRRARIEPFAWVVNQSLSNSGTCDPLLLGRQRAELRYLREVLEKFASRTALLPWKQEEPVGPDALVRLCGPA